MSFDAKAVGFLALLEAVRTVHTPQCRISNDFAGIEQVIGIERTL